MTEPVLIDWNEDKRAEFRNGVMTARHRLHMAPEFTDLALAALLERHPRELTDICTMGDDPADRESWRAGSACNMSGMQLIEAVREGKLWINLREAMNQDPVYKPIFDALFAQLKRLNPDYRPISAYGGILISSPKAQVFYHADVSETLLLHVKGKKRFRIYPPRAPWLSDQSMEQILHKTQTEDIPFDRAWDADAAMIDLTPGSFVSWPLHAPHRVENLEGLNVSVTCEVVTRQSMMKNAVLHANGALRRMGLNPRSSSPHGVQAVAKLAFSKAWKVWDKLAGGRKPMPKSEETFDVDLASEAGFRDRHAAAA
ncbi:cupin-like domain-containing protein [Hyphomonadaceae bacterium ML37]|nr:cupin-like domain-containing protein [Hyphomonadaceae bacterium ML37]